MKRWQVLTTGHDNPLAGAVVQAHPCVGCQHRGMSLQSQLQFAVCLLSCIQQSRGWIKVETALQPLQAYPILLTACCSAGRTHGLTISGKILPFESVFSMASCKPNAGQVQHTRLES